MRQRVVRWGARTLDVDLLFYDDINIDDPELTVPAPQLRRTPFRAGAAGRGRPRALPAGLGRTVAAQRGDCARTARMSELRPVSSRPSRRSIDAHTIGMVHAAVLGLLAHDDLEQLLVLLGAASTAGRRTAAGRTGAARRGWCRPASGTGTAAPTASWAARTRCPGPGCICAAARTGRPAPAAPRRTRRSRSTGSRSTSVIDRGSGPDRNGTTTGTSNSAATSHISSCCMPSAAFSTSRRRPARVGPPRAARCPR